MIHIPQKKSFTLIELLVVIAIVALLAALLLGAITVARKRAKLTTCLSNARQFATAAVLFASENGGQFLKITGRSGPHGMQRFDDEAQLRRFLKECGQLEVLYCPFRMEVYEAAAPGVADPAIDECRTGYMYMARNHLPDNYRAEGLSTKSNVILVADLIQDFTGSGDWLYGLGYNTNHMGDGEPEGGNVVYVDGHAKWKDFSKMSNKWETSGAKYYW